MTEKTIFDIQMFSEGAGGSEGGSESGLTGDFDADFNKFVLGSESSPVSQEENTEEGNSEEGTAAEDTAESEGAASENKEASEEDPEKEFEDLIKGKYKNAFHKRTQGIINERFKGSKETEGKLKVALDALAPLFDRYGIEEGDIEGLKGAVMQDEGIFAKKALEKGMDTESYMDQFNANREKIAKEAEDQARQRMELAKKQYQSWKDQEAEIRKTYPGFDLTKAYTENEEFKDLLHRGASVMSAYKGTHFDELTAGIVAAATQKVTKQAVDSMQANVTRPREGGVGSAGGTISSKDVGSLTGRDIDEILLKVGRGEKVTF